MSVIWIIRGDFLDGFTRNQIWARLPEAGIGHCQHWWGTWICIRRQHTLFVDFTSHKSSSSSSSSSLSPLENFRKILPVEEEAFMACYSARASIHARRAIGRGIDAQLELRFLLRRASWWSGSGFNVVLNRIQLDSRNLHTYHTLLSSL